MKKILLGLMAVSIVSFAVPDYNNPSANSTVWETGMEGKIAVNATLTTSPVIVRYVVFASNDNGATDVQDQLVLQPFVINSDALLSNFKGVNPKVYVKRVNGQNNGFEDLAPSDNVKFKIERNGGFASGNDATISNTDWFTTGTEVEMVPTSFIEDSQLSTLASAVGLAVNPGFIYKENSGGPWGAFKSANNVFFNHSSNGVLEVVSKTATNLLSVYVAIGGADLTNLNAQFAGNISGTAISVKVRLH